ncbi:hypothetical protein CGLAUT_01665 [Corynebacterium glaucum]|uniref:hypothetical protein n=1 Tax=Corynebacterium glaucum TaxID=187491 RepID=UPI0025B60431|nr:hypothetical protein [Corynebacterium glaucum]WJZ06842.1 hypothetical protein CGLAUT_01665 [Corynebacterium glaucum]
MGNGQKIVPNIWCNRSAEAVAAFYEAAFGAAGFAVSSEVATRYPETGEPVTTNLTIDGFKTSSA